MLFNLRRSYHVLSFVIVGEDMNTMMAVWRLWIFSKSMMSWRIAVNEKIVVNVEKIVLAVV